jgi:hypothetical protein
VVPGLAAALALPLLVALVALRRPTWLPVLDWAQTELRLRDVGTSGTPLTGLAGRIGTLTEQGTHPGPLSFYALAPVYRLLGSSAWAMQAATVVLQGVAVAAALVIARRRGGNGLALGLAAVLGVLLVGYGGRVLTEPWNPFLPVVLWVVFLLAVWSVMCGDPPVLLVAVLVGSFCAQTHVSYLGLAAGLTLMAAVAAAVQWRAAPAGGPERRRTVRWGIAAAIVGVVLWVPPVVDELVNEPGNLTILVEHFVGDPPEEPIGVGRSVGVLLERLDPVHLVAQVVDPGGLASGFDPATGIQSIPQEGNRVVGAAFFLLWVASVVVAVRMRHRSLVWLDAVLAVALALGALSIGRILGVVWYYLVLWVWGIAALAVLAVGWTAVELASRRLAPDRHRTWARAGGFALAAVVGICAVRFVIDAPGTEPGDLELSRVLAEVVPGTARALEDGVGAADGPDGRYLVTWDDSLAFGAQGQGLVNDLERRGFDVGVSEVFGVILTRHRVLEPEDATARLVLAVGDPVERWRSVPEAVEAVSVDPRSPSELERFDDLRDRVIESLEREGLDALVPEVDGNLFRVGTDPRVPARTRLWVNEMAALGVPTAVFILPPDVEA